jgi:hypothetical protein
LQPGSERFANPKRRGFLDQDQKRRLKGIIGGVLVAENTAADALDERAMALDQDGERELGGDRMARHESLEKLGVGEPAHDTVFEQGT